MSISTGAEEADRRTHSSVLQPFVDLDMEERQYEGGKGAGKGQVFDDVSCKSVDACQNTECVV